MLEISRWTGYSMVGGPVEVDSNQIETLVGNNQHSTTQVIVDILKISKSMELLVKMKKCVFYFMEKTKQTFWPTQYSFLFAVRKQQGEVNTISVTLSRYGVAFTEAWRRWFLRPMPPPHTHSKKTFLTSDTLGRQLQWSPHVHLGIFSLTTSFQ